MKTIKSYATVEKENREMRQLLAAYRGQEQLQQKKEKSNHQTPKPTRTKPTELSEQRTRPQSSSPSTTVHGKLEYKDGRLVDTDLLNKGFMRHTKASSQRHEDPGSALANGVTYSANKRLPEEDLEIRDRRDSLNPTQQPEVWVNGVCLSCNVLEAGKADTSDESLTVRSRLEPSDMSDIQHVLLSLEQQMMLLEKAHDLVRQGTWEAVKSHWPRDAMQSFPDHWKQVCFGFQELKDSGFGEWKWQSQMTELCGRNRREVYEAMYSVIDLRNSCCHPRVRSLQFVDELIKKAQDLLVLLQDEERTFAVRRLREEAHEGGREIVAHIQARDSSLLDDLPCPVPWPVHIQYLLRDTDSTRAAGYYPDYLVRAALRWQTSESRRVGDDLLPSEDLFPGEGLFA